MSIIPTRPPWSQLRIPGCQLCSRSSKRTYHLSRIAHDREREQEQSFEDYAADVKRRKRRVDEKRRQHGANFVDHMVVTVRGGSGGAGAAAFVPMKSSAYGPPSGGNGGQGGSVFFTTSPHLTSLSSIGKRLRGAGGGNGSGSFKHGRRGADLIVSLPVGTVVKEVRREPQEEKYAKDEKALNLDEEEKIKRRRERWFLKHPTGEIDELDYESAETVLYREGRIPSTRVLRSYSDENPMVLENQEVIDLDISKPLDEPILISPGGLGGLGNPHFFNSTNPHRSPRLASRGFSPPTITLSLELKLLADVGLVGFPNAGKSTILRALTGRKAEVAGYQFTTLNPQVGVVRVMDDGTWKGGTSEGEVIEETWKERKSEQDAKDRGEYIKNTSASFAATADGQPQGIERLRFTMSDNPGLLPQASENYGLGHSFLRSIERSLALAYVLDLTRASPEEDLETLKHELESYKPGLSQKGKLVILNKGDQVEKEVGRARREELVVKTKELGLELITVSAKYGLGMKKVVASLSRHVEEARIEEAKKDEAEGDDTPL